MEKLLEILEDVRPDVDFANEKFLVRDSVLDSFDVVTIVEEINEAFEIDIKPKYLTADNFNSVESMWSLITLLM
ncbi:MAG: acyl carrier protein [Hungatella sp.]|nr:acyl carrier protein [Hungatella sp.]MCI9362581.1 acyl carrier protein [Hungatella sp.]